MRTLTVAAKTERLSQVLGLIEQEMAAARAGEQVTMQVLVSAEELFVNVASYAYGGHEGEVTVSCDVVDDVITICFEDTGMPFDPVEKEDPELTEEAHHQRIGGLGILLVKRTMDSIHYERKDGRNRTAITKRITRDE
ncbi:ATP-binding protein [Ruminococcaceae bacterium OttesenSCG-928-I18]|nr:ATP-binding protein [Ruminococcaceae bacterium OttesenSCG-928-I18]